MPSIQTEIRTLRKLISQADRILATTPALPGNRAAACREVLSAALALSNDLLKQGSPAIAAATLGRKGGSTTSRLHGPEHYRQMAAERKTYGGGRPRNKSD